MPQKPLIIKNSYSVCIIEDDMVSQFASRYCLEQFSKDTFAINTFDSAEEALEQFEHWLQEGAVLPDVIFLDLGLGNMDGWEFMDKLQTLLDKDSTPNIFILSAFANSKDREVAQNHPMVSGYFDKPLTRNRLERIFKQKEV